MKKIPLSPQLACSYRQKIGVKGDMGGGLETGPHPPWAMF